MVVPIDINSILLISSLKTSLYYEKQNTIYSSMYDIRYITLL